MNKVGIENAITNIDNKYVTEALNYEKNNSHYRNITIRRWSRIAACFALVGLLSFSGALVALAKGNETAFNVVYSMFPEIAMQLVPVNESSEDNGIKMCVEGINIEGDSADVYISMQDLTGNRIDETIDLFDSYNLKTANDQAAGCSLVTYDEQMNKATFLINIQNMHGDIINKDKVTFSVKKFLSGKTKVDRELTEMVEFVNSVNTQSVKNLDIRGGSGYGEVGDDVLRENKEQTFTLAQGAIVTGYGFVNDKLHIQVRYSDILTFDNHGWIRLANGDREINPLSVSFWDEERKDSFTEYIFDISKTEIENYKVLGNFITTDTSTSGDWNVTFSLTGN